MKRVLIFSITYHPYIGGAEVAIKEITDRIPDVHFDLVTLRFASSVPYFERIGNVNIYRVGFVKKGEVQNLKIKFPLSLNKKFFPIFAFLQAMKLHRKHKYDLVWGMMANYAGLAALLWKIFYPNIPYLLSLQEGDPIEVIKKRVKFVHPLFAQIFRKADRIQTISNFLKSFALDFGYKGQMSVVPNGVDIKKFGAHFDSFAIENVRNQIGKHHIENDININGQNIIAITVSRLVKKNGVDTLIKAMKYLPQSARLVIIGEGPMLMELKELADDVAEDRVMFLGNMDHSKIPLYLKASDVFVRPSRSEGFGNAFVEAMASGIPVVATNVGGIPDFLVDPIFSGKEKATGLFCDENDPKSVASSIVRLVRDNELRHAIVENAKKMVSEKYDWDIIAKDMKDIFEDLMK